MHLRLSVQLLGLLFGVLLSSCGGGSGQPDTATRPAEVEPDAPAPTPGTPDTRPAADGSSALVVTDLVLSVEEDQVLSLKLSVTSGNLALFELHRQAEFGRVEIQQNGQFSYTPNAHFYGDDSFEYYAWDDQGGSLPATVRIKVTPVSDAPVILGDPPSVVRQGEAYHTQFYAADFDSEQLVFVASRVPGWLNLDEITGELAGIPGQADVGMFSVIISVLDSSGVVATYPEFSIEVIDVNDPPQLNISGFPAFLDARQQITVDLSPEDIDGDKVVISTAPDEHLAIEINEGTLLLKAADVEEVTDINLELTATDERGARTLQLIPLTLYPLNASGVARTVLGRKQGVGIHIVIVGDGYQQNEITSYRDHVDDLLALMREDPSIAAHIFALNIHAVTTASLDSGIDDQFSSDVRDTAFDSGYYCNGIARLICADELKMFDTALAEYPYLDQLILLANDQRFGGSGGSVAIASAFFPEIAIHEMGHSIARLADEYEDGSVEVPSAFTFIEGQFPNVSSLTDPSKVPWSHWIDDLNIYPTQLGEPGIGIFEGAYYRSTSLYRATTTSRMRSNIEHFGSVNGEQWVFSLYREIGAVLDFGPVSRRLELNAGEETKFYVQPLFDGTLQKIEWLLNDRLISQGNWQTNLDLLPPAGQHRLEVKVSDISGLIRSPKANPSSFSWHWELTVR